MVKKSRLGMRLNHFHKSMRARFYESTPIGPRCAALHSPRQRSIRFDGNFGILSSKEKQLKTNINAAATAALG